ncbi:MAG: hypothetical protein DRN68_07530, partial [Thaumarchaeota archaeon]
AWEKPLEVIRLRGRGISMAINERDIFWDWQAACEQQDVEAQKELAHYVLEDLNEVAKIFHEAKAYLKDPSFYAYESDDPPRRAREEVKALYECLQDRKPKAGGDYLAYVLEDVKSVRVRGKQRVRLAREVLFWGHGVCLDWVLLFAACIFHAHIYPLIIVTREHAVLGYWLREDDAKTFGQVVLSGADVKRLFNEQRIKVINATRIPPAEDSKLKPFDEAEEEAKTHLPYASFAVDIRKAREEGIKPLLPLEPWSRNHTLPPAEHFQQRPELEKIKDWWRNEGSYGVLALVGIGGAGKTALARRFLAQLPNSGVQDPKVGKDGTLPVPDALFVWNFYTHPDIDQCATELYNYLTGERIEGAKFDQVQEVLSRNWRGCRVLLVFDGVEKLQIASGIEPKEEGGTFGQFLPEGAPLARFLCWCCDGPRPVHLLITSRFPLTDLNRYESVGGYHTVEIGGLPPESARVLLKETLRREDIPNDQLDDLAQEFGYYAQILDLLGNALRIWCDSDPTRVNELPSLVDVEKLVRIRDKVWERVRVLRFYEKKLPPDTLIVLRLLSLFRILPVNEQLLTEICELGGILQNSSSLKGHLISLCDEYRLISSISGEGAKQFALHPAFKEYFYDSMDEKDRLKFHQIIADCLKKKTTNLILPEDRDGLTFLHELIYHLAITGRSQECYEIFIQKMGSYDHISKLDMQTLGLQTIQVILDSPSSDKLLLWQKARLLNDAGGFLRGLGLLDQALDHYREALNVLRGISDIDKESWDEIVFNRSVALRNPPRIYALQGKLKRAQADAERAYDHEYDVRDREGMQISLCMLAYSVGLQGEIKRALELYKHASSVYSEKEIYRKSYGIHWICLLLRCGAFEEVFKQINIIRNICPPELISKYCDLLEMLTSYREGHLPSGAQNKLGEIEQWAKQVRRTELEVWTQLVRAEIALHQANMADCHKVLQTGLLLAERSGYGLYWIDLQVVKGQWELACGRHLQAGKELPSELEIWTPQRWFERAEASALRALNGQLKDSGDPAPQPDLPENQLAMLGARHPECGYAWGEGDALHLLGEV